MEQLIENEMLPPESETGNVEYKLKIDIKSKTREGSLQCQMKRRIANGKEINGVPEAIYFIGINDDGTIGDSDMKDIKLSIDNLKLIAKSIDAKIKDVQIRKFSTGFVACVSVVRFEKIKKKKEIRLAFVGASGVGKTTLIAHLAYSITDNNGIGRRSVLKYAHEKEIGVTSSITNEIIGIKDNSIVNYTDYDDKIWENIYENSDKIVNLIDLPGDSKYFKTCLYGLTSYKPHYVVVVVSEDTYDKNSYDNICSILSSMNIRYITVVNKNDTASDTFIDTFKDSISINCITDEGIDSFKDYITELRLNDDITLKGSGKRFIVNSVIKNADVGTILTGVMTKGTLKVGDKVFIGPIKPNHITQNVRIASIHKKLIPSNSIFEDETGSIVLDKIIDKIDKYCIICSVEMLDCFKDELVFRTPTQTVVNSQYTAFFDNTVETVYIKDVSRDDDEFLTTVKFVKKNTLRPIFLDENIVLRNANELIIGKVL